MPPPLTLVLQILDHIEQHGWSLDAELLQATRQAVVDTTQADTATTDTAKNGLSTTGSAARLRRFELATSLLCDLAAHQPLALVVDDLHLADPSSLAFFSHLTRHLNVDRREVSGAAPALLFVGATTSDDTEGLSRNEVADEIVRARGLRLALQNLSPEQTARSLSLLLGKPHDRTELADWAYQATEGNPLFLNELLSSLRHRLVPEVDGHGFSFALEADDRTTVPATFADVVRRRLDPLSSAMRQALTFVSLFQQPVTAEVIATGLGQDVGIQHRTLHDLTRQRFLRVHDAVPARYGFRDEPVRRVVANLVSSHERSRLHAAAGQALEVQDKALDGRNLPELAYHFLASDPAGKGRRYAERAARWAYRIHAYPSALAQFHQALEATPLSDLRGRRRLCLDLARTYLETGQGQAAVRLLAPVVEETREDENDLLVLWRELGRAYLASGDYRKAGTCLRRCLQGLRGASPLIRLPLLLRRAEAAAGLGRYTAAILLGRFGLQWEERANGSDAAEHAVHVDLHRTLSRLSFQRGEFQEAEQHTARWLPLLRDAPLEKAAALNQMGNIHLRLGHPDQARHHYDQALALREKHGDLQGMAATLNNLGILDRRCGDPRRATAYFREAVKIQAKLGDRSAQATTLNNLANVYYDDARVDRAVETYRRSLLLSRQIGDLQSEAMIHANLGGIATLQGEYGTAVKHYLTSLQLRRRLRTPGRMHETLVSIASVLLDLGDTRRARRMLERVSRQNERARQPAVNLDVTFELGRIAEHERGFAEARHAYETTAESARALGLESLRAEAILALARLDLRQDRPLEAQANLDRGNHLLTRSGGHNALAARYALTRIELAVHTRSRAPAALARELEELLEVASSRDARPFMLDVIDRLAWIREEQGNAAGALDLYQRAADVLETMCRSVSTDRLGRTFLASHRVRRLEQAASAFRYRQDLVAPVSRAARPHRLDHLKSTLYDVERTLDFTKSRFDKQNAGLKRILEIARVMSTAWQTDGLFALILDSIMELTEAERGFVLIRNADAADGLHVTAARDRHKHDIQNPEREISYSVVSRVVDEGRSMMLRDAAGDDIIDHTQSVLRLDLRSIMCVPLVSSRETAGVLYVENRSRANRFTEDDLELLSIFAHQAAVALTNAELFRDLNRSLTELREAQDRLIRQEKLRLLAEMASGVLHNIKNLLTPVLGHAQILLMNPNNAPIAEDLRAIERLALDCRDVIKRFSNFTRGGDRPLEVTSVHLRALIDKVASDTRTRWATASAERRGAIQLKSDVNPALTISANAVQLREVMVNLIYNAADAMPDGGEILVQAHADREATTVTVADTGHGMTEEVRRKMFEPFFSTKKKKGMGMGMSVTEFIVHQHGGHIEVDSAPGKGTRITFRLPHREPSRREQPATATPGASPVALIVDDDDDVRRFASEALKAKGYQIQVASSGDEALERLQGMKSGPDLVLTDLRMPGVTGLAVAALVKKQHPRVPVIVMTAWPLDVPDNDPSVDEVVGKPVTLQELGDAVARATRPVRPHTIHEVATEAT